MAVAVFAVYKSVVVLKVFVTRVVGRVYVDDVNRARVGVVQYGEGVEVIAFNKGMVGRRPLGCF